MNKTSEEKKESKPPSTEEAALRLRTSISNVATLPKGAYKAADTAESEKASQESENKQQ